VRVRLLAATASFVLLQLLPVDFSYWQFAGLLFLNGLAMGAFASPNRAGVMNSLPAQHRGAGSGMNATFQNSAQVLSIGIFFTLVIVGLSSSLPSSLLHGLVSQGVPRSQAARVARLPPVSTLFAAFLGYDPMAHLLPRAVLHGLTRAQSSTLLGRSFFPRLIAAPFGSGLRTALDFAAAGCAVAAAASWARGRRYVYQPEVDAGTTEVGGQGPAGGRGPAPGDGEAGRDERHRGEVRRAGRVLLVDEDDEVLLLCGRDPSVAAAERFWFVPGGGAEDGESVEHAALREVREEVGAVLAEADLGPVVWARRVAFEFDGHRYDQDERFWVVRVARFASRPTGLTDMEVRMGTRARWWSLAELAGLDEPVYPHGLAALAANWLAEGPPPAPLDITGH
jgi:ADP-ribose pyrophosphatase YjhB (NUDIX family)